MADKKISALTGASTPLAGTEVLPIVQSGSTVKVSVANLTAGRAMAASAATFNPGTYAAFPAVIVAASSETSRNYQMGMISGGKWALYENIGPTKLLDVDSTGNTGFYGGNLIQGTAGKGINFTANTPAAGMTSQLLNWYEEGTWTPSVGGDATYFAQTGRYTRVGRLVTFTGTLYLNLIGTGSTTTISGLPFTASQRSAVCFGEVGGLATSVVALYGLINSGATTISIRGATAASAANASITAFQNVTYLDFSGQYTV
jgi:hypothetical protein